MRHRKILAILLPTVLVCAMLAGCAAKGAPAAWDASGAQPKYLTQLPDNEFTEKLVPPQGGTLEYVLDYGDSGRYAVFFQDISSEESAAYVDALKAAGYAEAQSAANEVSSFGSCARTRLWNGSASWGSRSTSS